MKEHRLGRDYRELVWDGVSCGVLELKMKGESDMKNRTQDDFKSYIALRDQGMKPKEMERLAESEGVTTIGRIALLRKVFGLSLIEAKAFLVSEDGSLESLSRHQETLIEPLKFVLEELERQDDS